MSITDKDRLDFLDSVINKNTVRGLIDVMIKNSSMRIEPEFLVGDLEFSEVLPKKYDWNTLMNTEFHEGWRVPYRWELLMLYEKCEKSHTNECFWSASPYTKYSNYSWLIYFNYGYVDYNVKSHAFRVRLVRDVSE